MEKESDAYYRMIQNLRNEITSLKKENQDYRKEIDKLKNEIEYRKLPYSKGLY